MEVAKKFSVYNTTWKSTKRVVRSFQKSLFCMDIFLFLFCLHQETSFFITFKNFIIQHYLKKDFCHKFAFLWIYYPPPPTYTHPFCWCSLTFVVLNRFCPLSTPIQPPCSEQKASSWIQHRPKLNEKCTPFLQCISSFIKVYTLYKKLWDAATSFLISCCFTLASNYWYSFSQFFRTSSNIT